MSKQDVIKKKSNLSFKLALCIVLLSALVLVVIYILVDTIESSAVIIIAFSIVLIVLLTFSMFIISSFSKKAKKSKKKERDAAERWRDIYAAAPIGVSFWDKDVKFIDCNDAVLEMMGFESREDYAQNYLRTWTKYQPSGLTSLEQGAQNFKKVFKQGYCHCVWTCLDAQGQAYPIECTLVRMIEDGEFKVAAYWIDLRPSREYEKKIVEAEERAQLMLDEAPIVIQYWDSDYNHIDCNRAAL
ncbi:MAG: PAS domain-containing protein, partial [Treponema sp.]|nr:PAS domain-containing protein [Treponema sp.]